MTRKPIFDAVRVLLGRGFTPAEVRALDFACDLAEGRYERAETVGDALPRLGALSEVYESGGRGPGTVSGGANDAGGVSYGVYQLASKTGTCAAFVRTEGQRWSALLGSHAPGSREFSSAWKAVASADPQGFREAQHAFIERTHYCPVIRAVLERTGLEIDRRSQGVRDAVWSCAVQHGGAAKIVADAVDRADRQAARGEPAYDRHLVEALYDRRVEYVLAVAKNRSLSAGTREQLVSITRKRYPEERGRALEMLAEGPSYEVKSMDALLRRNPTGIAAGAWRGRLRSHRGRAAFDSRATR